MPSWPSPSSIKPPMKSSMRILASTPCSSNEASVPVYSAFDNKASAILKDYM